MTASNDLRYPQNFSHNKVWMLHLEIELAAMADSYHQDHQFTAQLFADYALVAYSLALLHFDYMPEYRA
jgi:hypothetical protein